MTATKTHTYHGATIEPCESAEQGPYTSHKGQWIVRSYHGPTGMIYSDELCAHFHTLQNAREFIDIEIEDRERMGE